MWRPDWFGLARAEELILRLGQGCFQLWKENGPGLALINSVPTADIAHDQHSKIGEALNALLGQVPPDATFQVLVDSKWMPVALLDIGQRPLSQERVQLFARHRFTELYGDQAKDWRIQFSYTPGDRYALAVACADALMAAITHALSKADVASSRRITSVQSTLVWALNDHLDAAKGDEPLCLMLTEHDRTVLAFVIDKQLRGLHPCAPVIGGSASIRAMLHSSSLRCALVVGDCSVRIVSLEQPADMDMGRADTNVDWRVLSAAAKGLA